MPQDAFTLFHNAKELDTLLVGGKINKINMPSAEEVLLNIYTRNGGFKLIISANANKCRVSLTETEKDNPLTPFNFCMLLRKHLSGAEIKEVSLCGYERIIKIILLSKSDFFESEKTIYAEIMGKYSNIFLTESGKILGAMKTATLEETSKRILLTGSFYTFPPAQEKHEPQDREKIVQLINNYGGSDLAKHIFENIKGLAFSTAETLVNVYFKQTQNKTIDAEDFYTFFYAYLFDERILPCVKLVNGAPVDFLAKGEGMTFDTLNAAQNYFYTAKEGLQQFNELKRRLAEKVKTVQKKEEKKLAIILEKQNDCKNLEQIKIKGELLLSNIYRLKNGMESCKLDNYYDGTVIEIMLDKNLSISDNAQKYFKKYNKQKKTLLAVAPQLTETQAELNYFESITSELETAETLADLKEIEKELEFLFPVKKEEKNKSSKKKVESKPKEFTIDGFTIYSGRNNIQNDKLLALAKPNDLWFHTKGYHSSHIIIECGNSAPNDKVIEAAAEICAYHSKGRTGDKIPVDYCQRKYVKKPPKSKPGFVIYTDFKTCFVTPKSHIEILKV